MSRGSHGTKSKVLGIKKWRKVFWVNNHCFRENRPIGPIFLLKLHFSLSSRVALDPLAGRVFETAALEVLTNWANDHLQIATTCLKLPPFCSPNICYYNRDLTLINNHLSTTATNLGSRGWSLYTDLTVFVVNIVIKGSKGWNNWYQKNFVTLMQLTFHRPLFSRFYFHLSDKNIEIFIFDLSFIQSSKFWSVCWLICKYLYYLFFSLIQLVYLQKCKFTLVLSSANLLLKMQA